MLLKQRSFLYLGLLGTVFSPLAFSQTTITVTPAVTHDHLPNLRGVTPAPDAYSGVQHTREVKHIPHLNGPGVDTVVQGTPSTSTAAATTAGTGFDGIGNGVYGFAPNAAPPDTNGAVGATQYVQWVNESFAVFNKATHALVYGPVTGNTLWSGFGGACETRNDGDPIVKWDQAAQRWVMMQFAVPTNGPYYQCVAVSQTADATGGYNRYAFQYGAFNDYAKVGVWPDAYYVTFNMFSGNTFTGSNVCAYDRAAMLAGTAATQQCAQLSPSYGGLLPSDQDGASPVPTGSPNFLLNYTTNQLNLWKFHIDWANSANSTFSAPIAIAVSPFAAACNGGTCIPQPGTSNRLDSLADRLMYRLAYRSYTDHESLLVTHSVAVGSGTKRTPAVSAIRWYELRSPATTPVLYQQGTFNPDATFRWMGSAAMDKLGNIAIGYSTSSSTVAPGIRYATRAPGDTLGTLSNETVVVTGPGVQTGTLHRWGDYSSMVVDPVDDCTFWYTNEYQKTNGSFNWNTYINSFKVATCQ